MEMTRYSVEPKTRNYDKCYRYLSFGRNLPNQYGKRLLNALLNKD